jgi:hypothetical protein
MVILGLYRLLLCSICEIFVNSKSGPELCTRNRTHTLRYDLYTYCSIALKCSKSGPPIWVGGVKWATLGPCITPRVWIPKGGGGAFCFIRAFTLLKNLLRELVFVFIKKKTIIFNRPRQSRTQCMKLQKLSLQNERDLMCNMI